MKDLKSELSKNLERLIIGLMLTPAEFDAKMMRKAIEVLLIQAPSVCATNIPVIIDDGNWVERKCL